MAVSCGKMADKMSDNPEKTQVLSLLKQQGQPVALSVLLKKAGAAYSERTLRRWLAEWVALGLVQKSGQKRGTVYWAVDAEQSHSAGYFSSQSEKVLLKIKQPYSSRKLVSYHAN
jgi:pyridoxine/pyridoxamine 5'-phosphate oxidase